MIPAKVKKFLDEARIKYELLRHKTVYTAYDKAATLRLRANLIAKTLVVKYGSDFAIAAIPACYNLDKPAFKKVVNAWQRKKGLKAIKTVDFAKEQWMKNTLKGVKVGAVPPVGVLWKMPTFIDRTLLKNKEIVFSAGTYEDSVRITSASYKKLLPDLVVGSFVKKK